MNISSLPLRSGLVFAAAALLLSGCAPTMSGETYRSGEAMRAQTVEAGVVESIRVVTIEAPNTGVGTLGGAALGGIAGSTVGGGRGAAAGAVAGAIVGGVVGTAVEKDVNRRQGIEITVKLDSGRTIAIVQEATETFRPGDRIRVLSDGYRTRVTH